MRKTSVDIPAFLGVRCRFNNNPRDGNMIAFAQSSSHSFSLFVFLHLFGHIQTSTIFCRDGEPYDTAWQPTHWHHERGQSGIVIAQCLPGRLFFFFFSQQSHPPTPVTLESTSPLLPKCRPVSIQRPGQVPPVAPQRRPTGPGYC